MNPVEEKIKRVMSIVFEVPSETITENSSPDNIESWDSIKHMNLILALEEEFGIQIPEEEVGNILNFRLIELIINESNK